MLVSQNIDSRGLYKKLLREEQIIDLMKNLSQSTGGIPES